MTQTILQSVQAHWQELRGRTYDLLDVLADVDLDARLPFPESQNILYQFYCMLGTQESWPPVLLEGRMRDWDCSLKPAPAGEGLPIGRGAHSHGGRRRTLARGIRAGGLATRLQGWSDPLAGYYRLVEHESHHHGQLINLIYANNLPIPASWADSWALTRDGE